MGDGNHSLATAKQCYENLKKVTPEDQWAGLPARYALVEVVNNHDDALQFEPIHRVLFGVEPEQVLEAMKAAYPGAHEGEGEGHTIAYTYAGHTGTITVPNPRMQLAVGTLQTFLDAYLKEHGGEVDYIHGDEVTDELGSKSGNIGFKLPAMGKEQLFKTVMADGVLPCKTFSMGHAQDKAVLCGGPEDQVRSRFHRYRQRRRLLPAALFLLKPGKSRGTAAAFGGERLFKTGPSASGTSG